MAAKPAVRALVDPEPSRRTTSRRRRPRVRRNERARPPRTQSTAARRAHRRSGARRGCADRSGAATSACQHWTVDERVAAWAASGGMALTGCPDRPPLGPPAPLVERLAAIGRTLGVDALHL